MRSGVARAFASVPVLEPDDVVEVRRRDLEDRRVLEGGDAMHRPGAEVEARPRDHDLLVERLLAGVAELEPRAAALEVPALVLLTVELEREGLALLHEQDLPDVGVRVRPDQLPPPRLLDPTGLERNPVEGAVVRRVEAHASCRCGRHSACASMNSAARRRSFGVFTVSQTPSWRCACSLRSLASCGKVDCSWSPFSGSRASASSPST